MLLKFLNDDFYRLSKLGQLAYLEKVNISTKSSVSCPLSLTDSDQGTTTSKCFDSIIRIFAKVRAGTLARVYAETAKVDVRLFAGRSIWTPGLAAILKTH